MLPVVFHLKLRNFQQSMSSSILSRAHRAFFFNSRMGCSTWTSNRAVNLFPCFISCSVHDDNSFYRQLSLQNVAWSGCMFNVLCGLYETSILEVFPHFSTFSPVLPPMPVINNITPTLQKQTIWTPFQTSCAGRAFRFESPAAHFVKIDLRVIIKVISKK